MGEVERAELAERLRQLEQQQEHISDKEADLEARHERHRIRLAEEEETLERRSEVLARREEEFEAQVKAMREQVTAQSEQSRAQPDSLVQPEVQGRKRLASRKQVGRSASLAGGQSTGAPSEGPPSPTQQPPAETSGQSPAERRSGIMTWL